MVLIGVYLGRNALYTGLFPKLFSLKFLLVGFVVIGIVFSFVYLLVDLVAESTQAQLLFKDEFYVERTISERYLDYLYFSFISQLTVGYGDITTTNPFGKVLTILQGLLGAVFMGGLVAALLNLSREALNYLYIKSIRFHHCAAEANHGSEIFNMSINLYRTKGSLFRDFVLELISKDPNGNEFLIMRPESVQSKVADQMDCPLARKDSYPRFCEKDGRLAFETFSPRPKNITPHGFEGKAEIFSIYKLIARYRYSFESRLYEKEVEVTNLDEIGMLLSAPGRVDSSVIEYGRQ